MKTLCFSFVSIFAAAAVSATNLPPFISPCSQSRPADEYSSCILEQAKKAQPYFAKGIPELNVDPIDPLNLPDIDAAAGTFTIKSTNVLLKGLRKIEIRELKMDTEKNVGHTNIFGNFSFLSDYQTDGRVLLIPITGKGKLTVKMYDTEIKMKYKLRKIPGSDGSEHLQTYDMKFTYNIGNCKLHLSNILGGAEIGDTINQVLNDNWRDIMAEVGRPFIKAVIDRVHNIVNEFYNKVSYDEIIVP